MNKGWIGVDFDGTLCIYNSGDPKRNGLPIPKMVDRVNKWIANGIEVRIVTARVAAAQTDTERAISQLAIGKWLMKNIKLGGRPLQITAEKDYGMIELWDDRAVQLIPNTGERADGIA